MRATVESHARYMLQYAQSNDHDHGHRVAILRYRVAEVVMKTSWL